MPFQSATSKKQRLIYICDYNMVRRKLNLSGKTNNNLFTFTKRFVQLLFCKVMDNVLLKQFFPA